MVKNVSCGRCFNTHLNKKKSKCDCHFDRALTDDEAKEVEAAVNKVIAAKLCITDEMVSFEEANQPYPSSRRN
jgi:alanyl-tRNA synthetase